MSPQYQKSKLEDLAGIADLLKMCYDFPPPSLDIFCKKFPEIADEFYSGKDDEDKLLSNARCIPFEQNIRGIYKSMGGVSIVTSTPENRREGHVKQLLLYMFQKMKDNGHVCSTLYPFKDQFYGNIGYINCTPSKRLEISPKWLQKWKNLPTGYKLSRYNSQDALEFYEKVHSKAINNIHGGIRRSSKRWKELFKNSPNTVIAFNPEGEPEAILKYKVMGYGNQVFGPDNIGTMFISEFYWLTIRGRHSLFNFLYKHEDQIEKIYLPINPNHSFYYSWLEGYVKPKINPILVSMARIIDVENCIKNLPANAEGSIKIRVDDDQCPWNDKTFEIFSHNNVLNLKISENNENNARISIKGLTALVYGTISVREIEYLDWSDIKTEKEKKLLQDWFPVKPYWMFEDF